MIQFRRHWLISAGLALPGALLYRFGSSFCAEPYHQWVEFAGFSLALAGLVYFPFASKAEGIRRAKLSKSSKETLKSE